MINKTADFKSNSQKVNNDISEVTTLIFLIIDFGFHHGVE